MCFHLCPLPLVLPVDTSETSLALCSLCSSIKYLYVLLRVFRTQASVLQTKCSHVKDAPIP